MREARDVDSLLLTGFGPRLVLIERALASTLHPDSVRAYSRRLGRAATKELADLEAALRGRLPAPAVVLDVRACIRRALRLIEAALRASGVQVIYEAEPPELRAQTEEGALLRLFAAVLGDAADAATPAGVVNISLGGADGRPWVWLSTEVASDPTNPPRPPLELSPETQALASRIGVELEIKGPRPETTGGSGTLRLWLPPVIVTTKAAIARLKPASLEATALAARTSGPGNTTSVSGGPAQEIPPRAPLAMPDARTDAAAPTPSTQDTDRILGLVNARASTALEAFFTHSAPRRILVVDDEDALLGFFAAALPTIGIEFELASSADAALALVQPDHFSLAIVDKNLPDRSGLELLRSLRDVDPHLGAILITGYTSAHSVSAALELGVYDYLDKPFPDMPVLLSRIELALQRHALHARVARLAEALSSLGEVLPAAGGAADPRLSRIRALLAPTDAAPFRVAVLATPGVAEYLNDPLAPLLGAALLVPTNADELRAWLTAGAVPDLVVIEPALWPDGLTALVAACRPNEGPAAHVIALARDESLAPALDALAAGVADYLLVGDATPEQIRRRIQQALLRLRLHRRDRAILLDLLTVDIDHLMQPRHDEGPGRAELAAFEPLVGGSGEDG